MPSRQFRGLVVRWPLPRPNLLKGLGLRPPAMRAHAAVHPQPDDRDGEAAPEARGTDAAEPAPPVQPTPATKLHAPPRGIQRTVSNASEGSEGSRLRALDSVAAVFDLLGGRNLVSDMMTADAACALESESTSVASKDRMPKRRFVDANSARLPVSAKYVLNPNNAFMRWWDLVMFGLLVFTALATPYEVGFLRTQLDGMFWLNRFVDVLFLVVRMRAGLLVAHDPHCHVLTSCGARVRRAGHWCELFPPIL